MCNMKEYHCGIWVTGSKNVECGISGPLCHPPPDCLWLGVVYQVIQTPPSAYCPLVRNLVQKLFDLTSLINDVSTGVSFDTASLYYMTWRNVTWQCSGMIVSYQRENPVMTKMIYSLISIRFTSITLSILCNIKSLLGEIFILWFLTILLEDYCCAKHKVLCNKNWDGKNETKQWPVMKIKCFCMWKFCIIQFSSMSSHLDRWKAAKWSHIWHCL